MMDYKEKIRKLLALSQSENENEAKAALLKARELMAEHKLSELECVDMAAKKVKRVLTDYTATKRREPWLIYLASAIGEHYCCTAFRTHERGKQTQYIGFVGLEDDVDFCLEIFAYAVSCIRSTTKKIKRRLSHYYVAEYVRRECDSYGYGFVSGLLDAFEAQQKEKESEWGLVLTKSKEVQESTQDMGKAEFRSSAEDKLVKSAFNDGHADGSAFNPGRVLKGRQEEQVLLQA